MAVRRIRTSCPLDLRLTLSPLRHGPGDPTIRLDARESWRATRTPAGAASVRLTWSGAGELEVEAWGPGTEWALDRAPALVGLHDDPSSFRPADPALRALHRRLRGLRVGRSDAVMEALVPVVLEQKVTSEEAFRSYRELVLAHGEPAPGPLPLKVAPSPALLASLPYHAFHRFGIERRRADTIRVACSYARRLEESAGLPPEAARKRFLALPGIGAWTAAKVAGAALGDPDAVAVGDYHLPHLVAWFFAGEPRADDARMIELLEPYTGHRGRVLRLLVAGAGRPARRHPRRRLRSIAAI
ncbi:MAG: DNA-3-methyladenine glycosylase 2 family protein [Actinomycetota bacterium]|nr:DNA-3-methyladenine glycosylase 2 family protein [Actinomycetota bacterium]